MDIGPQSPSDNKFTAKCRKLQSEYRAKHLKQPYGHGPTKNSKQTYGNMLVNGESTGSNFISKVAFEFAKEKVEQKKTNKYLTIDEFRLFNNMLSSMPMCFNLFSDLRALSKEDSNEASRIVTILFREIQWIEAVREIDVEFIPTPIEEYTNDKSAFDAMLLVTTRDGSNGLISIETKYTDLLGSNTASDSLAKNQLVKEGAFFTESLVKQLETDGYKQIHRNWLLTYAFAKKNGYGRYANVVISPDEDTLSGSEIDKLKKGMTNYQDTIMKISLQDFVGRGITCYNDRIQNVMDKFNERYLRY
jgi:hypothetical protein